jgi:DNA-binding response OmpR family regulator
MKIGVGSDTRERKIDMLPSRAYSEPLPAISSTQSQAAPDRRPILVLAVQPADVDRFTTSRFTRLSAQNTGDAVRTIERSRPRVVVLDADLPQFDSTAILTAAHQTGVTSVLVVTDSPERAPHALKAGCHGVLLKPFAPNLVAARLGRLVRETLLTPAARRAAAVLLQHGTNRTWPDTACPTCGHMGAVSFEFSSYRRMWYACLQCDGVWLGPRQE